MLLRVLLSIVLVLLIVVSAIAATCGEADALIANYQLALTVEAYWVNELADCQAYRDQCWNAYVDACDDYDWHCWICGILPSECYTHYDLGKTCNETYDEFWRAVDDRDAAQDNASDAADAADDCYDALQDHANTCEVCN